MIVYSRAVDAKIEINLFYRTDERVKIITELYKSHGYNDILGTLAKFDEQYIIGLTP